LTTDHQPHVLGAGRPYPAGDSAQLAGEASVKGWRPFKMTLPAVSKHLKVLERAKLISRGRDAQWRPCRLRAEPLREVDDWVERYRQFWDESFDRLDDYLMELQSKEKDHDEPKDYR
jgi:DNA-binding transcriptional ArsR family regulator